MKGQSRWARTCGQASVVACVALALLVGIAVWLAAMALWEARNWSELKMEEIAYQLTTLGGVGNHMVEEYLLCCVAPAVAAAAVVGALSLRHRERPRPIRVGMVCAAGVIAGLLVYGGVLLDVGGYLVNINTESDYIQRNYADPKAVKLTFPERKRNLIYIWLESVEATYTDAEHGGAFDWNAIPELTRLAEEHVSFTGPEGGVNGGRSMAGATWTAGALFAQTAGLPLKIPIADSGMDSQKTFFPGVTNLGDLLAQQGYRQGLLIGSDATFGGRRLYFTQHGDYAIWDYNYSREIGQIPEEYKVWWGYEDEKLFRFAREHLEELAACAEPFNLSLLTVDTHFSNGYVCRLCSDEFGADQYSNVMACSSRQVADFVAWVQAQPFYENTTIVLCGDHITMDADYCAKVSGDYPRRVYTTIINPAAEVEEPARYREFTTFDLFPTTLAALGVEIKGERLGLGTNLFSRKETLLERDGFEKMDAELKRHSPFVDSLSGIDSAVYQLSETFAATRTELTVEFGEESLTYLVDGLAGIEESFTRLEVFAELMRGDTRTTLWYEPAQRRPDGSYAVSMPVSALAGNQVFSIHIYGTTSAGRIRVDTGYLCDAQARTLTREE